MLASIAMDLLSIHQVMIKQRCLGWLVVKAYLILYPSSTLYRFTYLNREAYGHGFQSLSSVYYIILALRNLGGKDSYEAKELNQEFCLYV